MKKADTKAIKHLTGNLPPLVEVVPCKYVLTGADLMLGGYKDLEPEKLYEIDSYAIHTISHEPKLKDAFKRNGVEGVRQYVEEAKSKYFNHV